MPFGIELDDAVALGIVYVIAEDGRAGAEVRERLEEAVRPIEYIVPKNQCHRIFADEGIGNQERLRDTLRLGLFAIFDGEAPGFAVAEELLEAGQVVRRGNEAKLAHAAFDEGRERVINHRFIVNRLQLFAGDQGQRIQSGPRTPGQDDAFHCLRA